MIQYNLYDKEDEDLTGGYEELGFAEDGDELASEDYERIRLDDPEDLEKEDEIVYDDDSSSEYAEDSVEINQPVSKTLISALRDELAKTEDKRMKLCFKYKGVYYEGIPVFEVNPNKFVFDMLNPSTDERIGKMKSFKLSEIVYVP